MVNKSYARTTRKALVFYDTCVLPFLKFHPLEYIPLRVCFFFFFYFFLFLAALGLYCCTLAFSSCGERRLLFVAVHGLLIAVASLAVEHGL